MEKFATRRSCLFGLFAVVLGAAMLVASASATYNTPKRGFWTNTSLVPAQDQCIAPTLTHRGAAAPGACVPVRTALAHPANDYTVDRATFSFRPAAGDAKLGFKSYSLRKNGSLYTGSDLTVVTTWRLTDNGCGAAPHDLDCTVVDFPSPSGVSCTGGACRSMATTVNSILPGTLYGGDRASLEMGQIALVDEDGDTVAHEGVTLDRVSAPQLARSHSGGFVIAHNACVAPTLSHRPSLALPACAPAPSSANSGSVYDFGPSGEFRYRLQVKTDRLAVKIVTDDVFRDGAAYSGGDLLMTAPLRITDSGCGPDPYSVSCTQVDVPLPISLNCIAGSCSAATPTISSLMPGVLSPEDGPRIELGQFVLLDEDGDVFARRGGLVR